MMTTMKKVRIVIAGGGFAGLSAAMHLDKRLARRPDIDVTLVSRVNFVLFTPMCTKWRRASFTLATLSIRYDEFFVT
jgi:NADH dehydrogenase FAD-containing subunit